MNHDIRVKVAVCDHPKTIKLIRLAGESSFRCLVRLWSTTAVSYSSGDLSQLDDESIEILAKWDGQPGRFVSSLIEVGFLNSDKTLHDWEEHQPWASRADSRRVAARENGRRGAAGRWGVGMAKNGETMADYSKAMAESKKPMADSSEAMAPSPSPTPTPKIKIGDTIHKDTNTSVGDSRKNGESAPNIDLEASLGGFVDRICTILQGGHLPQGSGVLTDSERKLWLRDLDLLNRIDGHPPAMVVKMFQILADGKLRKSGFDWARQIRSPGKLRQKRDGATYWNILADEYRAMNGVGKKENWVPIDRAREIAKRMEENV